MKNSSSATTGAFHHYHENYRCCCGSVHVKQGALLIAYAMIFLAVISMILVFLTPSNIYEDIFEGVTSVLQIVVCVLLIYGVKKEKKELIIPFIVFLILTAISFAIFLVLSIYTIFAPNSFFGEYVHHMLKEEKEDEFMKDNDANRMLTVLVAVFLSVAFALSFFVIVWWTAVGIKCFRYIRDLLENRRNSEISVKYSTDRV